MGIGAVIGGALQGAGAGLAETGRMAEEERRTIALENLRNSNRNASQSQRYDLADRNASRSDSRGDYFDARKTKRSTGSQIVIDDNRAGNQSKLQEERTKSAAALAKLQSGLRMNEQSAALAQRAAIEAENAGTYIKEYQVNDAGEIVGLTATGKVINTGAKAQPKAAKTGSGIGALADARAAAGGSPSGPAKVKESGIPTMGSEAAASTFVNNPANKGKKFKGPDGNVYQVN